MVYAPRMLGYHTPRISGAQRLARLSMLLMGGGYCGLGIALGILMTAAIVFRSSTPSGWGPFAWASGSYTRVGMQIAMCLLAGIAFLVLSRGVRRNSLGWVYTARIVALCNAGFVLYVGAEFMIAVFTHSLSPRDEFKYLIVGLTLEVAIGCAGLMSWMLERIVRQNRPDARRVAHWMP